MKKIMLLISVLSLLLIFVSLETKSYAADTNVFNQEVANLRADVVPGKVTLRWHIVEPLDVGKIEIYRNKDKADFENFGYLDHKDIKVAELMETENEFVITNHPSFMECDYIVKLVSRDGDVSKGKKIAVRGKHSRLIFDQIKERKMQIYLPPSYSKNQKKRYPVVYMHDGQAMLDFGVPEVMDRLVKEGKVEETIVVGVYNGGYKRGPEYNPFPEEWNNYDNSNYVNFVRMFTKKLIPYIDNKYRTIPNRENRAIIGASMGGLLSFWFAYNYSNLFSMAGCMSSAFHVGKFQSLRLMESQPKKDLKIWIDRGTREWFEYDRVAVDTLLKKGYRYGEQLVYYECKGAGHVASDWQNRIDSIFILFKGKKAKKVVSFRPDIEVMFNDELSYAEQYTPQTVGKYAYKYRKIFLTLNPIVKMDNGMEYSIYRSAKYEVLNKDAGTIDGAGNFKFYGKKDLKIRVTYKELVKTVVIKYADIDKILAFEGRNIDGSIRDN